MKYSFHDIGIYDLPAEINYVTGINPGKLIYIGHSMGTTQFFVFASERPDVASKVKAMFALSPVVFMGNLDAAVFREGANYFEYLEVNFRINMSRVKKIIFHHNYVIVFLFLVVVGKNGISAFFF